MPHINTYTYLTQSTWLIILFIIYYKYIKQYILPALLEKIYIKTFILSYTPKKYLQNKKNEITWYQFY